MAYFGCNHAQALNYQVNPTAEPLETCGGANPDSTGLCGLFLLYDPFSSMGLDCNDEGDCSQLTGDHSKYLVLENLFQKLLFEEMVHLNYKRVKVHQKKLSLLDFSFAVLQFQYQMELIQHKLKIL